MPGAVAATTVSTNAVEGNSRAKRATKSRNIVPAADSSSEDDDDAPLVGKSTPNGKANGKAKVPPKKKVKKEEDEDADFASGSDNDAPKRKTKKASSKVNGVANGKGKGRSKVKSEEASEDIIPVTPKKRAKRPPGSDEEKPKLKKRAAKMKKEEEEGEASSSQAKKKNGREDDEEEGKEVFRWWEAEDPNGDGSIKWTTLEHNGVYFPPPYQPLPSDVKMKYNGMDFARQRLASWLISRQANPSNSLLNLRKLLASMLHC